MMKSLHRWYEKIGEVLPFTLLTIGTVVIPLFFLPYTRDSLNLSKELFLFVVTSLALLFWFLRVALTKQVRIRHTILDIPLVLFIVFVSISFLFSRSPAASFFGVTHQFVLHLLAIIPVVLWAWLLIQEVRTPRRLYLCVTAFLLSGIGTLIIFLFGNTVFLQDIFQFDVIGFNTVSTLNSVFGVYITCVALVSLGVVLKKGNSLWEYIIPIIAFFLSIWGMVSLGFAVVWVLFALGLALTILFGWFAVERVHTWILSGVLLLCIISMLLAIFGTPVKVKSVLPVEVTLSFATSWEITQQSLLVGVKSFLVGSGPGMFVYDFSAFRPALFNTNELVSDIRFYVPFNTFFALTTEFGLLGIVSFFVIILIVLGAVATSWKQLSLSKFKKVERFLLHKAPVSLDGFILSIVWIIATIGMGVVFYDMTMWWLWWWLLGMSMVGLSVGASPLIREKIYTLKLSPQYSLLVSFGIVIVTMVMSIFGAFGIRFYMSEVFFTKAQSAEIHASQKYIEQALSYRQQYAPYHIALARVHLQHARIETEKADRDDAVVEERLALAVNQADIATEIAPYDVDVWDTLAFMYMNARTMSPEANTWAEEALMKAIRLEPTNAFLYWRLGNVYEFQEKFDRAEGSYKKALVLKPNYVAVYTSMGDMYEKQGNIDAAIVAYQSALDQAVDQTNILYHLGRLFFNRANEEDIVIAEQAWLIVVEKKPDHSNALYSLGLLYENKKEFGTAIEYYQKVGELHPDNTDVKIKIQQLLGR
jgi:tetratricopeptide (TPR) repeat protein